MFEKVFHVTKLIIKRKTLLILILRKNLGFWMKLGQILLGEKKEQRVQAKKTKSNSYFN